MGKFLNALKNIGTKINGKTPTSTTTVAVLNEIANDYEAPLPAYPATTDDKTYVLKLVDGVLTWVEETPAAE